MKFKRSISQKKRLGFGNRRYAEKGFSLLEILVAVVILAILIAIGIFMVGKGVESSYRIQCAGNLRKLASRIFTYASDNDQKLPRASGSQILMNRRIPVTLRPYFEDDISLQEAFTCYANKGLIEANKTLATKVGAYIVNTHVFGHGFDEVIGQPLTIPETLNRPMEQNWLFLDRDSWSYPVSSAPDGSYLPVHDVGRNTLYIDGAVVYRKSVKGKIP